ncbi:MAG: zinc ribbon domain-containing protein [Promethearchaeota archaeon]|nr:MAG: zinc ribbon domain-containing protein [Candidatus Lokiarchaeota archaeon]
MVQDPNNMMFCESCRMNVYPTRQRFNIKIFGIFAILMLSLFISITIVSFSIFSEIFLIIFIMWGFMILNPYLLYYGLQKKQHCPRCLKRTVEKNLEYKPFGVKEPEIYKILAPSKTSLIIWHCPYCGTPLSERAKFCRSCGKKFEIQR